MFRSFFKFLLFVILLTFMVIAVALVAAPYFVRQDQVKAFVEKNIFLPDNKKLILSEEIDFGFFPYMYFETKKVQIVGEKVPPQILENVKFGFSINDLLGKGIDFSIRTRYLNVDFDANIELSDYRGFYQKGETPIVAKVVKPVPFNLKGDLKIEDKKKSFRNFVLNHKKTTVKGTINHQLMDSKNQRIDGNVVIDTDNVDDLRRLAFYDNYDDKFNLLEGVGKVVLGFNTRGYDDYTFRKNLIAEGSFKLNNVNVYGFDLDEIARNPFEIRFVEDYARKINISTASGLFAVDRGVARLKEIEANSDKLKLQTKGTVDLAEENLNLDTDLALDLVTQKVDVPLKIKGTFEKPKITPRYDEAIMKNLPNLLQNKNLQNLDPKKLGEEILQGKDVKDIKDNLKNLLQGL